MRLKVDNIRVTALLALSALLVFERAAPAETNIYLVSRVETAGPVTLGDIARVDGGRNAVALRRTPIAAELYSDGFVDRGELEKLLAGSAPEALFIYGNAVKVLRVQKTDAEDAKDEGGGLLVNRGDTVGVSVRNRGIVIRITGSAMEDGKKGDEITIRVRGNRTLRGKIIDKRVVESCM
jgi:hypothetical protein